MAQLYVIQTNATQSLDELSEAHFPNLDVLMDQMPDDNEARKLKLALTEYARRSKAPFVPCALWSLGYFFDASLIGFLREQLRFHLDGGAESYAALGQCIIALDTLGEDILPDGRFDASDHEANSAIASRYMARHPE